MSRSGGEGVNPVLTADSVPSMDWKPRAAGTTLGPLPFRQVCGETVHATTQGGQPRITLYTSAVCGYCIAAKNFLKSQGLDWTEVRVDLDPAQRERMVALTGRTTVPQIFIGDVHVGGYDDMMALHRAGRLKPLLEGGVAP
jgi:glutaredoxin 3